MSLGSALRVVRITIFLCVCVCVSDTERESILKEEVCLWEVEILCERVHAPVCMCLHRLEYCARGSAPVLRLRVPTSCSEQEREKLRIRFQTAGQQQQQHGAPTHLAHTALKTQTHTSHTDRGAATAR